VAALLWALDVADSLQATSEARLLSCLLVVVHPEGWECSAVLLLGWECSAGHCCCTAGVGEDERPSAWQAATVSHGKAPECQQVGTALREEEDIEQCLVRLSAQRALKQQLLQLLHAADGIAAAGRVM